MGCKSRPTPTTYKIRNWPTYHEALKRRGSLTIWFDPEMTWDGVPTGGRGRQQTYSDTAIRTCLTMKVLFGMALRQTTGFVENLLRPVGLGWSAPDFSTLSRRQKTLTVNIPYRGAKGPLHLLVDSTGIKVAGEGEWHARKHGGPKRRIWRKIHLGIDKETLEVRAVEITGSHIGDAPVLPDRLSQIPEGQEIGSVTADGAYDTRKCHDAIADRGADALIPPRKNAKPWKAVTAGAMARNEALRAAKNLGRAFWRRWSGCHRRSRVETMMHCVKLLGQRRRARDFDRQVAELQVRIAVLNGYTALSIPVTEAVE
ncbi:IS5 family transposase [Thalassococcus sp. CAU 1522]|uniref:IS5 family transposase n=1 Tax=Thalassococcus arenae TaxID=2851652 RepID=A0ABS6N3K8_9RHOB|nr:IS5 family transposase [Thalassococcus arenae]MBV2358596.1 IS5 family transposase [Thalassococcus arenae]